MRLKTFKYFSTLIVFAAALTAGWLLWTYYMQSPWTRDGKVRAEQVNITPQVSGTLTRLAVRDNQLVKAGSVLFTIDETPYRISVLNAQAQLARASSEVAKAHSEVAKANNEANRRRHLPRNYISAEDLDTANISVEAAQASLEAAEADLKAAQAALEQANWQLSQTTVKAPVDGWVTNLSSRAGNYATAGQPVFALVDSRSFYVVGYFEETKLRHIRPGIPARVTLYSGHQQLTGKVDSIGRAIYDQSVESDSGLVADIKPNVPWVRLAQRVPVRIALDPVPNELSLFSGTTCTVSLGP
ncbi:MAG TPA: efflux transporter periplasmic adaptor subunit [Franconibacter pulveris]|nr:efflux transporter periplasmic adaptor subunit [Franconibacter pulveris]